MTSERDFPKLQNQPLTLVLAEFRFSPLSLEDDVSEGFRSALSQHLGVEAVARSRQDVVFDSRGIRVAMVPFLTWEARGSGHWVHLEEQRLVYATTRYPRFDGFSGECEAVLSLLADSCEIDQLARVGLRYNDCVIPAEDENLSSYLKGEFLPSTDLCGEQPVVSHVTETSLRTEVGHMVVRSIVGVHGRSFMPDVIQQFNLPPREDVPHDRPIAVLDFDHYWQISEGIRVDFSVDRAIETLGQLHKPARSAFWNATTDYARQERWL